MASITWRWWKTDPLGVTALTGHFTGACDHLTIWRHRLLQSHGWGAACRCPRASHTFYSYGENDAENDITTNLPLSNNCMWADATAQCHRLINSDIRTYQKRTDRQTDSSKRHRLSTDKQTDSQSSKRHKLTMDRQKIDINKSSNHAY